MGAVWPTGTGTAETDLASLAMTAPLWTPDAHRSSTSQVEEFRSAVGVEGGYRELHRWSVEHPGDFWQAAWEHLGVVGDPGARPILSTGNHPTDTRFFPDGHLNFAENLLHDADDSPAILYRGEGAAAGTSPAGTSTTSYHDSNRRSWTWAWSPATGWRRGYPTSPRPTP